MKRFVAMMMALMMGLSLFGCYTAGGNGGDGSYKLGDKVSTMFFEFSVDSAQWVDEVNGYTASEGKVLLETKITMKNITGSAIPMGIYDFQAQWGDDENDEAFTYQSEDITGEDIIPLEFTLEAGESATYRVIFEVPAGSTQLSISTLDYYTDENGDDAEGDVYFVYFQLEAKS